MDSPNSAVKIRFNRLLPYWAVLQTDLRQTTRSWVYRLWLLMTIMAAGGAILYKVGIHREAGIVHSASVQTGNLLRGLFAGSLGLVALLAVTSISAERSTVADAVLSRGISRYQYFLAKWHARLFVILSTFALLAAGVLTAHHFLLDQDLSFEGTLWAIAIIAAGLAVIVTWGVTIGALTNSTVLGITIFWVMLYGGFLSLSLLPESYPTPERLLGKLNYVLQGQFEKIHFSLIFGIAGGLCLGAAFIGMLGFSRKDV